MSCDFISEEFYKVFSPIGGLYALNLKDEYTMILCLSSGFDSF
jgi:hypothetical protein